MSEAPKKKAAGAKKPADHPKYSEMVEAAIITLKERNGSSRQAIIKYIGANYKVGENSDTHVKQALKRGVSSGQLSQTKGTGASGSFKVVKKEAPKKPKTPKPKTVKPKPTKPKNKKAAAKSKKPVAKSPKKKPAAKKPAKKTASPKKPAKKPAAKKPAKKPAKPAAKKGGKKAGAKKGGKK